MASRAGRGGDCWHACEDLGAVVADEGDVERIWKPLVGMAVEDNSIAECRTKTVPEQVAQPLHLGHADPGLSDLTGFAERRGQQSAFRSGAPPTLVASAVD